MPRRPGSIYYLLVGDRVKIGFTTDLYQRMMQYPPFSELLALHPGTPKLEKEMHAKFTRYLADGREWFHPNEELTTHLAEVNEKFPLKTSIAKIRERLVAPAASTLRPRSSSMVRKV